MNKLSTKNKQRKIILNKQLKIKFVGGNTQGHLSKFSNKHDCYITKVRIRSFVYYENEKHMELLAIQQLTWSIPNLQAWHLMEMSGKV